MFGVKIKAKSFFFLIFIHLHSKKETDTYSEKVTKIKKGKKFPF